MQEIITTRKNKIPEQSFSNGELGYAARDSK